MLISFAIHMCILLFISILGITYVAVFCHKEESTLEYKVNYLPEQVVMYKAGGFEEIQQPLFSPLKSSNDKFVENKEKEEKEEISALKKDVEEHFSEKEIKDKYEVVASVQSSPIKKVRESKSFEDIDINSEEFKKCASKLFWNIKKLETLEEIKNYYKEIHFVRDCPTEKDCVMIDSYVNRTYHICHNPTDSDFNNYPFSAKVTAFNNFPELSSFSQQMLSGIRCNRENYSEIFILCPKSHWIEMFNCFEKFLSKYNLSLDDDKVKRVCTRYVKNGSNYTIEVESVTIEKDGKDIQISN